MIVCKTESTWFERVKYAPGVLRHASSGGIFFLFSFIPRPTYYQTVSNVIHLNRDAWLGWTIEGMISDLEFEIKTREWAKDMFERFPHSPHRHEYYALMKDAERRIRSLS